MKFTELSVRIQHEAVVDTRRFHSRTTRQNGLTTTTVTGEVVLHDTAREDHVVNVADVLITPHGRAARGRTEILEVFFLLAFVVVHLQTTGYVSAHGFDHFFMGHVAVRT